MKDLFSSNSDQYARYRPTYPAPFFEYLGTLVQNKEAAWDCGTGNGQVASVLAKSFRHVYATDISQSQLDQAIKAENIRYSVQPAEAVSFPDRFFDLIIVAQAVHWFDFDKFYQEVRRVGKERSILALIGYGLLKSEPELDRVVAYLYRDIVGTYWDKERRYIDEMYRTIPFPLEELKVPEFQNTFEWSFDHLVGYLNTWSATRNFVKQNQSNPVEMLRPDLEKAWGSGEVKTISFPLMVRLGRVGNLYG